MLRERLARVQARLNAAAGTRNVFTLGSTDVGDLGSAPVMSATRTARSSNAQGALIERGVQIELDFSLASLLSEDGLACYAAVVEAAWQLGHPLNPASSTGPGARASGSITPPSRADRVDRLAGRLVAQAGYAEAGMIEFARLARCIGPNRFGPRPGISLARRVAALRAGYREAGAAAQTTAAVSVPRDQPRRPDSAPPPGRPSSVPHGGPQ